MNIKEWHIACDEGWAPRRYDNASREIQKSLKYNPNTNATVRHHLRDTEEQRKYNDEHYELWGFEIDENGNEHFEYGKYIIFLTPDEHNAIHAVCEDTRKKRSESLKGHIVSQTTRHRISIANSGKRHINRRYSPEMRSHFKDSYTGRDRCGENNPFYGKHHTDETRQKISIANKGKLSGENHPLYNKHHTDEARQKMSESAKNRAPMSYETKLKIGAASRGRPNVMKGKHISDQTKENIRKSKEVQMGMRSKWYKKYKSLGGNLSWNEFQKMIPLHTDELVNKSME